MTGILNILAGALGVAKDTYFNLVSLLLPGNGTNGAQNNTFLDASTNNFTITRNGNTTQGTFSPFSQTGWSGSFNTSTTYLTVTDTSNLRFGSSNFTIEAFVYRAASGATQTIASKGASTPTGWVFQISSADKLVFTDTSTSITGATSLAANTWYYVAVVRAGTGSNQTTLYVNAVSDATGTSATTFSQTDNMKIGADRSNTNFANGYISNLRLSNTNRTISSTPTSALAADSNTIFLGLYNNRFQYTDSTAAFTNMTVTGTPSVQAFSPFNPSASWSAATYGGSGYFDGSGDYLSVASNAAFDLGTGAFTFEAFIYPTSSSNSSIIHGTSAGFIVNLNSSQVTVRLYAVADLLTSAGTLVLNAWNHIAIARSGTTLSMWLNGSRTSGGTVSNSSNFAQTGFNIGTNETGAASFYAGYMSQHRLVKGTAVYDPTQTTITVPTAPLTAVSGTSLLLNFTNAGITDATAKNDLETVGNAQISTTVNTPFNGTNGSMYFDGAGSPADRLTGPNTQNTAFGTGNFVIEFFVYPTSSSATFRSLFDSRSGAVNTGISIWQNGTSIEIYGASQQFVASSVFTINSWQHVAVSRSSNTVRVYVGGTQRGSNYTNSNDMTDTRLVIGNDNSLAYPFVGYISNFRITKGNDRNYTGATITVPSAPFPVQ